MYIYIYIYIPGNVFRLLNLTFFPCRRPVALTFSGHLAWVDQNSSKGDAVETGCSGLHYVIGSFII